MVPELCLFSRPCHSGVGVPGKISGSFSQMPIVPPVLPKNGSLGVRQCGVAYHVTTSGSPQMVVRAIALKTGQANPFME